MTTLTHLDDLTEALAAFRPSAGHLEAWARHLAGVFAAGGKLLACGNGGSAAEAQHLTAELVGRYRDERKPLPAIALHADTSSTTAICNDYGHEEVFARQVRAHGRPGDVLICLSTSGASRNLLSAAVAARECGVTVWGFTGPVPNPLASLCDDVIPVEAREACTVQEVQLAAVHMLCEALDEIVLAQPPAAGVVPGLTTPAGTTTAPATAPATAAASAGAAAAASAAPGPATPAASPPSPRRATSGGRGAGAPGAATPRGRGALRGTTP
ncbi:SIS domain-containing protein [Bailinhaonella thermotolerans]|uniref:SIS domain-containing protein n=1 Tax=Bailinhaonella thermotolerans TaxID=1070861 RepID=A0A3A4B7D8_9ACTN|nr:SIS domain-containing protein [Bailinhaonella thermotolerans]